MAFTDDANVIAGVNDQNPTISERVYKITKTWKHVIKLHGFNVDSDYQRIETLPAIYFTSLYGTLNNDH